MFQVSDKPPEKLEIIVCTCTWGWGGRQAHVCMTGTQYECGGQRTVSQSWLSSSTLRGASLGSKCLGPFHHVYLGDLASTKLEKVSVMN